MRTEGEATQPTTLSYRAVRLYLDAKACVEAAGFSAEIDAYWTAPGGPFSEREFLQEAAWVILSCGLSEQVVRQCFPRVTRAFCDWESAHAIVCHAERCRRRALGAFRNRRKINAILTVARHVVGQGIASVRASLVVDGPDALLHLPFFGPATSKHLAKNLGMAVAKPDRHLLRIAAAIGYESVDNLCSDIAAMTGHPVGAVDHVLWRHAALEARSHGVCL